MIFKKALPVFPEGKEKEMNLFVGFTATVSDGGKVILRITGSTTYSIFVNGNFICQGPARAGRGTYRVDEIPLYSYLEDGENLLCIKLLHQGCNTFQYFMDDGFLQAEIERDGTVECYTAPKGGFRAYILDELVQKVPRYSFQRGFEEVYFINSFKAQFVTDPSKSGYKPVPLEKVRVRNLIPRGIPNASFAYSPAESVIETGSAAFAETGIGTQRYNLEETYRCFATEELKNNPESEVAGIETVAESFESAAVADFALKENRYALYDMGRELTGFISLKVNVLKDTVLYLLFEEVLMNGKLEYLRNNTGNVVVYHLAKGEYTLQTAEPYSFRYLKAINKGGEVLINDIGIVNVGFRNITRRLNSESEEELKVYEAAVSTFRQNAYDIYMDCPSRERAGWLCDSYFTSRTEYALTGKSDIERNFLENFIIADEFPNLPEGMLPMCYPAEFMDGNFIPNWAMFFVLELEEYLARSGDTELVARAKDRVMGLAGYFTRFENSDGLLEKLEAWVFVEWSHANDLCQDVNFPTNALYAEMLDVIDRLYGMPEYHEKAEKIRKFIRKNALIGDFFCDNMVRKDGELVLSGDCTEACQYYMFYLGVATPQLNPKLWEILKEEFGPDRAAKGIHPEIFPANAFIGNYLRLDLLFRFRLYDQLLSEIGGYFMYMAERTGTLWENTGDYASCNHGFASSVVVWLLKIRGYLD